MKAECPSIATKDKAPEKKNNKSGNSLIKSLIHKINKRKNFQNFLASTNRCNRKENVKNNKKIKKY